MLLNQYWIYATDYSSNHIILLYFLIDMVLMMKNQESVEL